jgi:RhtB (resistance to homoserine/threonine) family protein
MLGTLLAFAGVAWLATLVPGPDTAVVVKNALVRGRRAAVAAAAGCSTGQLGWGAAAMGGVAALLATSVVAFSVVKWVGVAYLLYLGVRSLRSAATREAAAAPVAGRAGGYREGLLVNALNPKTALFMSALLPQFVTPDSPWWLTVALVAITATVSFTWMSCYAIVFATFGDVLRRPRVRRLIDGLMGTVLIGFGARLAASHQP